MTSGIYKHKPHSIETRLKMSKIRIGMIFSEKHREALSEAHKGQIVSEQTREKLSKTLKGRVISKDTRIKISKALIGHPVSEELKSKMREISLNMSNDTKRKMGEAKRGIKLSLKHKKRISESLVGKMPKNIQRAGKYGNIKSGYYCINNKNIFFRSGWEANYALYLDFLVKQKQIKKWEYEPEVFVFKKIKFGTRSYRPDFKVTENDGSVKYHEVKGFFDNQSKTKIKRMAKYYPNIKLIIIDQYVYKDIKSKLGKILKFY